MSEEVSSTESEEVKYVKRYMPVYGVGTFLCADCIVDAAKDYILDEFPEVAYYETHKGDNNDELVEVAMKCLVLLAKKFPTPNFSIFFLDAGNLVSNPLPGTIFIGSNYDTMGMDETKMNFFGRVRDALLNLNIFNKKEDNKDNLSKEIEEHDHEIDEFEIDVVLDVCTIFSEKQNEDDKDDLDIGYENGMSDGLDEHYELVKVALYKMYKKKKIKDLDFILDELHNTIAGMDSEEMQLYQKKFTNYIEKKKIKESELETGDE